jgi:hypothetical protein
MSFVHKLILCDSLVGCFAFSSYLDEVDQLYNTLGIHKNEGIEQCQNAVMI